ncbi:MAG: hypothetical protein RBJ76_05610 [Stenomitos frigidus ULC029]
MSDVESMEVLSKVQESVTRPANVFASEISLYLRFQGLGCPLM